MAPLLISAATLMQSTTPATADGPRGYAFGAAWIAYHPASSVYYRSIITPVHGNSFDVSGGGGAFLTRTLAVEGEIVYGGAVSTQQYTYYEQNARDVMLGGLARFRPSESPRLQLVAGTGLAWTRTWEDPAQSRPLPERAHVFALTFGTDVVVADTPHMAIAPSFRVRWLNRELDFGPGLGRITYQIGATVFVR